MPTSFSQSAYANTTYSGADIMATISIKNTDNHKNALYVLGELQTLSYSTHMNRSAVRKFGNVNAIDFTNGPRTIAGSLVFAVFNKHIIRPILEQMQVKQEILPDELPPFDITITYANEYGHNSVMRIYGVRLVNEGQVCSINDVYTENTYQYVAQNIELLTDTRFDSYTSNAGHSGQNESVITTQTDVNKPKIEDFIDLAPPMDITPPKPTTVRSNLICKVVSYDKVWFDVLPRQDDLQLVITGNYQDNTYDIAKDKWPYILTLPVGTYVATLCKKDGTTFNSITVVMQAKPVGTPIITYVSDTIIKGKIPDTNIVNVYCRDSWGHRVKSNILNNSFVFTNLEPDTEYFLNCEDIYRTNSPEVKVKTNKSHEVDSYTNFLAFLKDNRLDSSRAHDFIKRAMDLNDDLLVGSFYLYEKEKNETDDRNFYEKIMHLISYYYVSINQKTNNFIYVNKWLNQIKSHPQAKYFKAYSKKGMFKNLYQHEGLIKLQQNYANAIENIITYQPPADYYHSIQNQYEQSKKAHEILKDRFNIRYSNTIEIDSNYGYYDAFISSKGAYIEIQGDKLIGHFSEPSAYLVFKDDLNLEVGFKIKIQKHDPVDFKQLSFYNPNNTYLVYIENKNKECISKSVTIKKSKVYYNYDALLSLAIDYNMHDIVIQSLYRKSHAFDTFCDGVFLLINRQNDLVKFLNLFDKYLYSNNKEEYINPMREDSYLKFNEAVQFVLFDSKGNYVSHGFSTSIKERLSGYCIWSSEKYKVSYLNFSNM